MSDAGEMDHQRGTYLFHYENLTTWPHLMAGSLESVLSRNFVHEGRRGVGFCGQLPVPSQSDSNILALL